MIKGRALRIAISQRFLPHYRIAFFTALHDVITSEGGAFKLFYSFTMGKTVVPPFAVRLPALRRDMHIAELDESAVFAPSLVLELRRFQPDVVVLEDLAGILNSAPAAAYLRLARVPFLVWGLGEVPQKRRSRLRKALGPLIRFLYASASGFVCYSEHAASVYRRYGKPTFVAPNSAMSAPTPTEVMRVMASIERRSTAGVRLVSIGAIREQKRFDILIQALALLPGDVTLDLIGDGPGRKDLERLAAANGLQQRVRFHGAIYDHAEKLRVVESADIGVIPGRGGLAIQELLAAGLPVVSGVADGTERDLLRDGVNGFLFDEMPSAEQLAERILEFARYDREKRLAMSREALDTVVHRSNIENMVAGMWKGIRTISRASQR